MHGGKKAFAALEGGPEARGPLDQSDAAMTQLDQVIDHPLDHFAVVRLDQMLGFVERGRAHTHIAAPHFAAQRCEIVIFRDRGQDQHAIETLLLEEIADIIEHGGRMAINRPDDESEFGIADCVEHAFLEIEHSLRIGVVVQQTDQEVAPQRQRARLRVWSIAKLGDDLLDLRARRFPQQGRSVDDTADGLLGYSSHPRHIIDRRGRSGLSHIFTTFRNFVFSIASSQENGRAAYHYIRRRCGNFVLTPVSFFANVARKYGKFEEGTP